MDSFLEGTSGEVEARAKILLCNSKGVLLCSWDLVMCLFGQITLGRGSLVCYDICTDLQVSEKLLLTVLAQNCKLQKWFSPDICKHTSFDSYSSPKTEVTHTLVTLPRKVFTYLKRSLLNFTTSIVLQLCWSVALQLL